MDLFPVDWLPFVATMAGVPYMKIVPYDDPNVTFGMSLAGFFPGAVLQLQDERRRRLLLRAGIPAFPQILFPVNLLLEGVGLIAKPISLSLRLFGNMYAVK